MSKYNYNMAKQKSRGKKRAWEIAARVPSNNPMQLSQTAQPVYYQDDFMTIAQKRSLRNGRSETATSGAVYDVECTKQPRKHVKRRSGSRRSNYKKRLKVIPIQSCFEYSYRAGGIKFIPIVQRHGCRQAGNANGELFWGCVVAVPWGIRCAEFMFYHN